MIDLSSYLQTKKLKGIIEFDLNEVIINSKSEIKFEEILRKKKEPKKSEESKKESDDEEEERKDFPIKLVEENEIVDLVDILKENNFEVKEVKDKYVIKKLTKDEIK